MKRKTRDIHYNLETFTGGIETDQWVNLLLLVILLFYWNKFLSWQDCKAMYTFEWLSLLNKTHGYQRIPSH